MHDDDDADFGEGSAFSTFILKLKTIRKLSLISLDFIITCTQLSIIICSSQVIGSFRQTTHQTLVFAT